MTPTDFERTVVRIIKSHGHMNSISAGALRHELLARGIGRHPAAVAMNLTKLAYKERYITGYVSNSDRRVFVLTSEGNAL